MKKRFWLVVVLLVLAVGLFLRHKGFLGGDDDNPCIKNAREAAKGFNTSPINLLDSSKKPLRMPGSPAIERWPFREVNQGRREFACGFPPMAVIERIPADPRSPRFLELLPYPRRRAPGCIKDAHVKKVETSLRDKVAAVATSVGKLKVVGTAGTMFWGTGFVISPHLVATTCHNVDSLLIDQNMLDLGGDSMYIEFQNPARQCQIDAKVPVVCSQSLGLDVALLKVLDNSCMTNGSLPTASSLPSPVVLDAEDPSGLSGQNRTLLAVIGYGDLDHPVDADTDDLYGAFKEYPALDKFLMWDLAPAVQDCGGLKILLDAASTTVGESGGVLVKVGKVPEGQDLFKSIDVMQGDDPPFPVVGIHTCCATFFAGIEKGTPPTDYSNPCTQVKRTLDNQDISIKSVLDDATLCKALRDDSNGQICSTKNKR